MTENEWLHIGVEFGVLVGGFVILYWKQRVEAEHRFTKLEMMVKGLDNSVAGLSADHKGLDGKVSGISRKVAELTGACVRIKEKGET